MDSMTDDSNLDFLDEPAPVDGARPATAQTATAQASVEAVRTHLLDWAARALAVRAPLASVYRGNKGVAQCRLDLDRHLKAVLDPAIDNGEALARYRLWALEAIWLPRGSSPADFDTGLHTLAEALVRFVQWPHGLHLAARVAGAACEHDPQVQSGIAQRCTSG